MTDTQITSRCELVRYYFGFYGVIDSNVFFPVIGYGSDEIEVIADSGNYDWCTTILDLAVNGGIIPPFRDANGDGNIDDGDCGNNCFFDDNPDNNPSTNPVVNKPAFPIPVILLLSWLTTRT